MNLVQILIDFVDMRRDGIKLLIDCTLVLVMLEAGRRGVASWTLVDALMVMHVLLLVVILTLSAHAEVYDVDWLFVHKYFDVEHVIAIITNNQE